MSNEATNPIWEDEKSAEWRIPLGLTSPVDVVVVGAGITGLSAALRLARAGKSVLVVDRGRLGESTTAMTSAHVTALVDTPYHLLIDQLGFETAQATFLAANDAIRRIEAHAAEMGDVGFARVPGYVWAGDVEQRETLNNEAVALRSFGVAITWPTDNPLPFLNEGVIAVPDQARLHPQKYLSGLARLCEDTGVRVAEEVAVVGYEESPEGCIVETDEGTKIHCHHIVLATHMAPTRLALQTRCIAYTSYVVAFHAPRETWEADDLLACDLADPYHYIRTLKRGDETWWVVGGNDHRTGQGGDTLAHFAELQRWCHKHFGVHEESIPYRWSSQVVETLDTLPFIGRLPGQERVFVATGFGGTGLTWGTLGGEMLADAILGVATAYDTLFAPERFDPIAEGPRGVKAMTRTGVAYLRDYFGAPEVQAFDEIHPGSGCHLRHGVKHYAGYRDERGRLKVLDAVCPHLGGIVHFNAATKTWDCACHGSRFDTDGHVLEGPAVEGLRRIGTDELTELDATLTPAAQVVGAGG